MTKKAYIGLIILAVEIAVFISFALWFPHWKVPHETGYDVLRDTLEIVVTIITVGMGVTGYGIYLILKDRLEKKSIESAHLEIKLGAARTYNHLGFIFWTHYERDKQHTHHLDMAIDLVERAHRYMDEIPVEQLKERRIEKLLGAIKNNSAYYLAERGRARDKALAKTYIGFLRSMKGKYREQIDAWEDTCNFVDEKFAVKDPDHKA